MEENRGFCAETGLNIFKTLSNIFINFSLSSFVYEWGMENLISFKMQKSVILNNLMNLFASHDKLRIIKYNFMQTKYK